MSSNWNYPYKREESYREMSERNFNVSTKPPTIHSGYQPSLASNSIVDAIQRNIQPITGTVQDLSDSNDSNHSSMLAHGGLAMAFSDTTLQNDARGSYVHDAAPGPSAHAYTVKMVTVTPGVQIPKRRCLPCAGPMAMGPAPMANSSMASAPDSTYEMVTVAPGVQILKKKYLPRFLPMPIGTPPTGRGRPILGRPSLYSVPDQPEPSSSNSASEVGAATQSSPAGVTSANNKSHQVEILKKRNN